MGQPGELEDVGVTSGNADKPAAMTTDQERHVRLYRPDAQVVDRHDVVRAAERRLAIIEQRPQHLHRLVEPADPFGWRAQQQPDRVVLGLHVSGAQPEHQPAATQTIDGRSRSGQHRRVVELVVQDQGSDANRGGGFGGDDQRHERVDLADVIERKQLVVPQRFGLSSGDDERVVVAECTGLQTEAERAEHGATVVARAEP